MLTFYFVKNVLSLVRLGDIAPDFVQDSQLGPIHLHEYLGNSWGVLFSHPGDFTPVCTTELGTVASLSAEFKRRNTIPIGLSVDSVEDHIEWIEDIEDIRNTTVDFPILADVDHKVSRLYDMIHPEELATQTVRSVFIIDPKKKVRLTLTYPAAVGRNFDELLRSIDAIQLGDKYGIATPADWRPGEDVLLSPDCITEQAAKRLNQNVDVKRPYYRVTPDPSLNPSAGVRPEVDPVPEEDIQQKFINVFLEKALTLIGEAGFDDIVIPTGYQ